MTGFTINMTAAPSGPDSDPIKALVESAFEFLTRAAAEFQTHPKFSIINFATAIELICKARLTKEHWTLIVENSSNAVLSDFRAGKSKTVSTDEAIKRLKNVCGEVIPDDAKAAFRSIADHRNRVVHFYHESASTRATPQQIEEIVKEQCKTWFHLERLLLQWRSTLAVSLAEIDRVDRLMRRNFEYLKTIYDAKLPEIEADRKKGRKFLVCGGCKFEAADATYHTKMLVEAHCRVCGLSENYVEVSCPEDGCNSVIRVTADRSSEFKCESCGHEIDDREVSDALDTEMVDPTDFDTPKNCAFCMGYHSVVKHYDYYVCVECFNFTKEIAGCEWCNELQIGGGDLEGSYYSGCEFCDGKAGHDGDRD